MMSPVKRRVMGVRVSVGKDAGVPVEGVFVEGGGVGVGAGAVGDEGGAVATSGVRVGSSTASGAGDSGGEEGAGVVAPQAASHAPAKVVTIRVRRNKSRLARDLFCQLGS